MHPNEELVRRLYAARAQGDNDVIREILAEDVFWSDPYPPPFGGEFHGIAELFDGLFLAIAEKLDDNGFDLHDVIANDTHAVALVEWWSVRHGRRMDGREVGVYHIREGKIQEVWFMTDDRAAAAAFLVGMGYPPV